MRPAIATLVMLVAAAPAAAGAKEAPTLTGSVTTTGALQGTFSWKPDLAITCGCVQEQKVGQIDATMTDGAGTFIAIQARIDGELVLTSGKLRETMKGTGRAGTCSSSNYGLTLGRIELPLEATLKGKSGATVTVKGSLICK